MMIAGQRRQRDGARLSKSSATLTLGKWKREALIGVHYGTAAETSATRLHLIRKSFKAHAENLFTVQRSAEHTKPHWLWSECPPSPTPPAPLPPPSRANHHRPTKINQISLIATLITSACPRKTIAVIRLLTVARTLCSRTGVGEWGYPAVTV